MARTTFCVKKLAVTGVDDFHFLNAGGVADANSTVATATTDNAAVLTAINNMGSLSGYSALTGAAAALAAAQAAQATVATDLASITNSTSADVVVSVDLSKITSVTLLRKALQAVVREAEGGQGGLPA